MPKKAPRKEDVLRLKGSAPLGGIKDIRPALKRVAIQAVLSPQELMDIASTLYGGRQLKLFIEGLLETTELPIIKSNWLIRFLP